jgi:S-adenosyl-L-methionine hydrolase (adenosine-forming)
MPLLTLTTDIGVQDFMPAAIKGSLLQRNSNFNIIDVTHLLSPFNFPQAAYVCKNAIAAFPQGSFHLILINIFDQKQIKPILIEHNGHYIGCMDNGLATMILNQAPEKVVALELDNTGGLHTLKIVECFAQAFNQLLQGKKIEEIGTATAIRTSNPLRPMLGNNWIEGQILFIDNFENVIINITKEAFEEQRAGRKFSIVFKRDEVIDKISNSYADVPEGEKLALFNSANYLEIAVNKGNAASLFGLQTFSEKQEQILKLQFANNHIFYQTIKVFFE